MDMIDTHAHLDEIEHLPSALHEALDAGVIAILAVGMSYESNEKALEMAARHNGLIYPSIGLHPWHLAQIDSAGIERVLYQIEDNIQAAVAVGEIGLDYDKRLRAMVSKERQQATLRDLLSLAAKHEKPVSIHSRYAWKDALNLAVACGPKAAVFHWFTGPSSVLQVVIAHGYLLSATPAAEYHAEHRRAVRAAPPSQLLLETDSPVRYGTSVKWASAPKDVLRSLRAAAEIRGEDWVPLAERTTENAWRFFGKRTGA